MKRILLPVVCVALTACAALQAQAPAYPQPDRPPAYPQPEPRSETPRTNAESPAVTSTLPPYPAGTKRCERPIGVPLEMVADAGPRIWVETEYLWWWMRGAALPPLITASPADTPATQAGVLGAPTTAILFGDNRVNDNGRSGGRFTLGAWLNECRTLGVEGDFFLLSSRGSGFVASSTGSPILARPFLDATTGRPNSELVAFPGLLAGTVSAHSASTGLLGADAMLRANLCRGCDYQLDLIGGYRYLRLSDGLGVAENLLSTSPNNPNFVPLGTSFILADQFYTRNEFHGFNFGLKGKLCRGPWVLEGRAQMAVGDNREVVNISGATTVTVPGFPPLTSSGGLLALSSNIGHFSKDRVEVILEFGVRAGYQVTPSFRVFAGYTFLYWDQVLRAGTEVDQAVNPNLLPNAGTPVTGPRRPMPLLNNSSFWAQGVEVGLALRF